MTPGKPPDAEHRPPDDAELAAGLGRTRVLWDALKTGLAEAHGPLAEEWTASGRKHPFILKLRRGKRAIVYLSPGRGEFRACFALGEKAVARLQDAGLPAEVLALIDAAPRYVEGRAVRIPVRRKADLAAVLAVAAAKMAS